MAARDAIAAWARLTYGWMGRSPDYKAAFLATLGANADFYAPYQDNARRWYREAQERVLYLNHALVHPPVDRHRPPDEVADVYIHVEKETDAGLIVSGAKVVATGSALTHYNFIAHPSTAPIKTKEFARDLHRRHGHAGREADLPPVVRHDGRGDGQPLRLSALAAGWTRTTPSWSWTRPWSRGRTSSSTRTSTKSQHVLPALRLPPARHVPRLHAAGREAGLHRRPAAEGGGRRRLQREPRRAGRRRRGDRLAQPVLGPQRRHGARARAVGRRHRAAQPGVRRRPTGCFSTVAYPRVKELIESILASGLIYLNSHAVDFQTPALRPYLDQYLRGSDGTDAVERVKLMKLLWDAVGTEFGGRHELYERNYAGAPRPIRVHHAADAPRRAGQAERFRGFAEQCMAEYDLDGWTVPDLITPDETSSRFPGRPL